MHKLKKAFCFISALCLLFSFTMIGCAASYYSDDSKYLNKIMPLLAGDWYNNNGKLILAIQDNHINDGEIVKLVNLAGGSDLAGGQFLVATAREKREMYLSWRTFGDLHDFLVYNNEKLHKANKGYYESVCNVYLGMPRQQVISTLGQPTSLTKQASDSELFFYQKEDIQLNIYQGEVENITIFRGSSSTFDRSGLNCSAGLKEYADAYKLTDKIDRGIYEIGKTGEFLFFGDYPNSIMISTYPN